MTAGDKGLYSVYSFQLISCITNGIAVQLACALAMKVGICMLVSTLPAVGPHWQHAVRTLAAMFGRTKHGSQCGNALQDLYHGFHPQDDSSIFVYISVFAAGQLLLSQLPTMRHLRHLNLVAVVCTAVFVVIVSTECIKAGELCAFAAVYV